MYHIFFIHSSVSGHLIQQLLNWAPSFHSCSIPGYSAYKWSEWDWKCKSKHFHVFPFLFIKSQIFTKIYKACWYYSWKSGWSKCFSGPSPHLSPTALHTCHQMSSLQITGICTTGVDSLLIEHALVLQYSLPRCLQPVSKAAIYSTRSDSLRTGLTAAVHTLDSRGNQEAAVGRAESTWILDKMIWDIHIYV